MKTQLSMLTATATALLLAATSLAASEAKNEAPFTRTVKVQTQAMKALFAESKALNQRYHLGIYAAETKPPTNYQALKERYPELF